MMISTESSTLVKSLLKESFLLYQKVIETCCYTNRFLHKFLGSYFLSLLRNND